MRVAGVIPARWGSTRFPGKSLALIAGKPLVQHVIERCRMARSVEALIVATDDRRIFEAAGKFGARAVMTRADHPSGTDRIAEAVGDIDAEVVINIQGDEPLIDPVLIDCLAEGMLKDSTWDMATAAAPIRLPADLTNPSVVKVVWDANHKALYFSRSLIPFVRDNDIGGDVTLHWRHIGLYAYRREFLGRLVTTPQSLLEKAEKLEQLRALSIGGRILVVETNETGMGVDTPADVKYVEALLEKSGLPGTAEQKLALISILRGN